MVVKRLQPYNQELVDELRRKFFEKYPSGDDLFDRRDVARVKKYDKYLYNILIISKSNVDTSLDKLEKILTWRKENKINDLSWDMFDNAIVGEPPMYAHGRDKDNCRILWFNVRCHKKGDAEHSRMVKLYIAFWLERMQWEDFDNPIIILEDMTGAGISNMELDVVKFLIGCLELYFPALCNMLYMYEMPWILNAIWKVIERILSEESKAHLRFIKQRDVPTYFDLDQIPPHMGGTDTFKWTYPPPEEFKDTEKDSDRESGSEEEDEEAEEEVRGGSDGDDADDTMHSLVEEGEEGGRQGTAPDPPATAPPDRETAEDDGKTLKAVENLPKVETNVSQRKVHFAENALPAGKENSSPERSLLQAKPKRKTAPSKKKTKSREVHVGPLLTIRPGEDLLFKPAGKKTNPKEMKSTMDLSNTTDGKVAYKVKTTSPYKYRVKTSTGHINPGASVKIQITFLGGDGDQILRDKFQVLSTEFGSSEVVKSPADLTDFWKKVSRSMIVEHRLKCLCETPPEALITNHDILKEIQALSQRVTRSEERSERALSLINRRQLMMNVLLVLLIAMVAYILYSLPISNPPPELPERSCYKE